MTAPLGAPATIQDAVYGTLRAHDPLRLFLNSFNNDLDPRIYEGIAPPGTLLRAPGTDQPWPYITLRGPAEDPLGAYGAPATDALVVVSVWVPGTLERLAKIGAEQVRWLLDGRPLVTPGYELWSATAGGLLVQSDPDGQATQARREFRFHMVPTDE